MQFVQHRCPHCKTIAPAPIAAVEAGDAGVWHCEACDNAYQIQIEFRHISPDVLEKKRRELLASDASLDETEAETEQFEELQRRLFDIENEIGRLNQLIDDLHSEADRLRDELEEE